MLCCTILKFTFETLNALWKVYKLWNETANNSNYIHKTSGYPYFFTCVASRKKLKHIVVHFDVSINVRLLGFVYKF